MSLTLEEYKRYGRQMVLADWGLPGQLRLKAARVAVVGAGGLGCPVLQYLAGAGVGTIDVHDHDTVSVSNLHRQILHPTEAVGLAKADSAASAIKALNPHINVVPHTSPIEPSTALDALRSAQIIVDCTDRPHTRYLLADVATRLGVPLVSGAAISSSGQWAVYGGDLAAPAQAGSSSSAPDIKGKRRACYRCIWPQILPGSSGRCDEFGVWNVVTGMVGTGMAGEVIKLILGNTDPQHLLHTLHLNQNPLIRTIRLRPPQRTCIACGPDASITDDLAAVGYDAFCTSAGVDLDADEAKVQGLRDGASGERISAAELAQRLRETAAATSVRGKCKVVDTRPEVEFGICSLPGSINIPLDRILKDPSSADLHEAERDTVFICRLGNDSRVAAQAVRRVLLSPQTAESASGDKGSGGEARRILDVRGGLAAWSAEVDPDFPVY